MADEEPKSATITRYDIADVAALKEWQDFTTKSTAFEKAKQALIDAKSVVREMFREDQNIADDANIDFSIQGNSVVLILYREKKQAERKRATKSTFGAGRAKPGLTIPRRQ